MDENDDLEKYRAFFENVGDPMQILHNGAFVDCNQATVEALGFDTKEECINVHPAALSPEFQPDGKSSREKGSEMMALTERNGTHRFEWIHTRKNGVEFPVEVLLTSVVSHGE